VNWHIFLSYSTIDDIPVGFESVGWVTRFRTALEAAVPQALGRTVRVWSNERLDGNEYFRDTLDSNLANSSLLVPVISPSYLLDPALSSDRTKFIEAAAGTGGLRLRNKSRICPVFKSRVDERKLPKEFSALNRKYEFYDQKTGILLKGDSYDDLVREFANTAKEMLEALEKPTVTVKGTGRSLRKVFLASATSDVMRKYDDVANELKALEYSILPDIDLANQTSAGQDEIERALAQCCLSIHLIGGDWESSTEYSRAIQLQFDAAQRQVRDGLVQLVWTPRYLPDIDTLSAAANEAGRSIYAKLKEPSGFEFSRDNFNDWLLFAKRKLKALQFPEFPEWKQREGDDWPPGLKRKAYLVCDDADRPLLEPIKDRFKDGDWFVEFLPSTDDETKFSKLHRTNLIDCQAYVIYYGTTESYWVDMQRNAFRMANAMCKGRPPFYSKWIYRGPKTNPEKTSYKTEEDYLIDGDLENPFTDDFVEKVKKSRAESARVLSQGRAGEK
jgi:hypothetical protein